MFDVAGANMFGQWFSDEAVVEGFEIVSKQFPEKNFDLDRAKLVQVNWSYNIFDIDGVLYLSGLWMREERQLIVLPIPNDFPQDCITMLVAGNDREILFIDAEKQLIFSMDLSLKGIVKKINLGPEGLPANTPKDDNKKNEVTKVMMTNKACIYMRFVNSQMKVYAGLTPSFPLTDHIMDRIIDVQCGYEHYMLLTDTGKVYTWGSGSQNQLGHGGTANVLKPREVTALAGYNVKKIRAGGWHSAVITEFGNLYMWGRNDVGQLGIKSRAMRRKELRDGTSSQRIETYPLSTVVNIYDDDLNMVPLEVIDVGCGSKHTVIVLSDNSVWASGSNEYGQLGLPIKDYYHIEHYIKVYQASSNSVLRCGPWTTVIIN